MAWPLRRQEGQSLKMKRVSRAALSPVQDSKEKELNEAWREQDGLCHSGVGREAGEKP